MKTGQNKMNFDEYQQAYSDMSTLPRRCIADPQDASSDRHEKINKFYICVLVFFSWIGGFVFGYDASVIAGANLYIDNDFPDVTTFQKELIVSMTMLGAAIGSITGGSISDQFGRKPAIFVADLLFSAGSMLMAFTPSITVLIWGRLIVGFGVGTTAVVVPVYLAEVAPKQIRGIIVSVNNASITFGEFIALMICLLLGEKWRYMLGLAAVPAFLQAVGILFLWESPRFLYKRYKDKKAEAAICQIYDENVKNLQNVLNEQKLEAERIRKYENFGYFKMLKQLFTKYQPWIIAGCGLQILQQFCGINAVMYYGPEIMRTAGFGDNTHKADSLISAIPLAALNALGGIIVLFFIDSLGRRWIMLRTLPFIASFMGIVGIGMGLKNHVFQDDEIVQVIGKWTTAFGVSLFLLTFSFGMAATPWTVNSEIYPLHLRGIGNSVATATNWTFNFTITICFLTMLNDVPYGDMLAFFILMTLTASGIIFVYLKVPETKGLSMDQVLALFVDEDHKNSSVP